jgi:hypothetical protein
VLDTGAGAAGVVCATRLGSTTCLCRRGRLDVVIFEAVMRRLLGDPQRLASRAAERPIAAHRRPRTASIQGLQCAAKQTSRQGANAKLRKFGLFPAKRGERSLVEPRKGQLISRCFNSYAAPDGSREAGAELDGSINKLFSACRRSADTGC